MNKQYCQFNKFKSSLLETILSEGKHWPEDYKKTAINTIKNSELGKQSWYTDDFIEKDVDTFIQEFGPLSHKNSNLGYFGTIIKWFTQYAGSDKNKYQEFIERKLDGIIRDLLWLSNAPQEEAKVKDELKQKWSFDDFEKFQKDVIEKNRNNSNIDIKVDAAVKYNLIPINTYNQLHQMFGGDKTGYEGNSEWCHTNGLSTYDSWIHDGKNMFFILARENWETIRPPKPETTNAYDKYGTSLIALLVEISTNKLLNATLRWNHIIEPSDTVSGASVDHAFSSWNELNKLAGFDVEAKALEGLKLKNDELEKKRKNANNYLLSIIKNIQSRGHVNISIELLGESGFNDDLINYITKIEIPEGIEKIERSVFSEFSNVTEIKLPSTLKSIESFGFWRTSVETLEIPDSVETIGKEAFGFSEKLKTVKLSKKLENISDSLFRVCTLLESVEIPDSVSFIGHRAFENCYSLKTVKMGNGVINIDEYAFRNCNVLNSIEFSNSLKRIKDSAFSGCTSLESVILPNSVELIEDNAFWTCSKLKEIVFPKSLKQLQNSVFHSCESLESIEIPEGIEHISNYSFSGCSNLKKVVIHGNTLKTIEYKAFQNCINLETVVLPDSLMAIKEGAFQECYKLKEINFPKNLEFIGSFAFYTCEKLTSVQLPSNLKTIKNNAFQNCIGIESIEIPDSVELLEHSAFYSCQSLKEAKIGKNIKSIERNLFYNCLDLEKIEIPDGITAIYDSAFKKCESLKEFKIPNTVEYIENSAFENCKNLEKLTLPKNLKRIESNIVKCSPKVKIVGTPKAIELFNKANDPNRFESNTMRFVKFKKLFFESIASKYDPPLTLDQIKKNYSEKYYNSLSNDPIHRWRAENGIELIHKEPTQDEFERIVKNWNLMDDEMKKKSDEFSLKNFGAKNMDRVDLLRKEYSLHVGDRVKVIDNIRCRQAGQTGTIIDTPEGRDEKTNYGWKNFYVKFDDPNLGVVSFQSGSIDRI